ncbi:unknown [Candidatus Colimorpha enterica]|uniref:Uncharacterized protein n=1 Tax=Candidatus Colimorpha enterica TaxID=3083063 RepID=R6U7J7_9BACT|nr:unknown [Candidatus Colimorpha enterica]
MEILTAEGYHVPDKPARNYLLCPHDPRHKAVVEHHLSGDPIFRGKRGKHIRLLRRDRKRLFAIDVLPGKNGLFRRLKMQDIRRADIDYVNIRRINKLILIGDRDIKTVFPRRFFRCLPVSGTDPGDPCRYSVAEKVIQIVNGISVRFSHRTEADKTDIHCLSGNNYTPSPAVI